MHIARQILLPFSFVLSQCHCIVNVLHCRRCSQRTDKSKYNLLFVVLTNWRFAHDRRTRGLGPAGQAGYQPLDGCADGMSAEQMRALPIVIAEKRSSRRAASGEDGQLHKAPELIDLLLVGH